MNGNVNFSYFAYSKFSLTVFIVLPLDDGIV